MVDELENIAAGMLTIMLGAGLAWWLGSWINHWLDKRQR